jgi:hypothetical protein
MRGDKPAPKPEPNGNQQKFAWIYALGADTTLSAPAKTVATLTALKLAGHKGHFKATHKAIANLCGMTYRTVRRAADELAYQNYWDIGSGAGAGAANVYLIIPPDERIEMWLDAEGDHRSLCRRWLDAEQQFAWEWLSAEKQFIKQWLDAEKQFIQKWLDAEQQCITDWLVAEMDEEDKYQRQVFDAVWDRCGNSEFAMGTAKRAWQAHQDGQLPLAKALRVIAAKPQDTFPEPDQPPETDNPPTLEMDNPLSTSGQPPVHRWTTPCPQVDNPLSNSDTPTSANDHSHKSFKSIKTLKDSKGSPASRALNARCAGSPNQPLDTHAYTRTYTPQDCPYCRGQNTFVDIECVPIVLLDDDGEEMEVDCQHSLAGNLAEILRIEKESNGHWGLACTGYPEIDRLYGF